LDTNISKGHVASIFSPHYTVQQPRKLRILVCYYYCYYYYYIIIIIKYISQYKTQMPTKLDQ